MGFHRVSRVIVKNILKSTHIAEQHLFSMFHSIFAFDFDSISGGPMSYFLDWDKFQNLGSSFKDEKVLFSVPPAIIVTAQQQPQPQQQNNYYCSLVETK